MIPLFCIFCILVKMSAVVPGDPQPDSESSHQESDPSLDSHPTESDAEVRICLIFYFFSFVSTLYLPALDGAFE